ncbi:MAG: CYTH domain-containing protein [Oscillospiraceae bacterium]|jgi:HD superfamily phosphohydrolase|nr:CYTH domain-containing protein [Oscillospiraceae bacterium]
MKELTYIRDVIHGDIELLPEFRAVVDTYEFQRLHRINQLAIMSTMFPNAHHTRFEHSLGTYHVMSKAIEHFRELFIGMGKEQTPAIDDSKIALLAALLHDVGHGPFSHAFEKVCGIKHEDWTKKIINESIELNNIIKKWFGHDAPERLIKCIDGKNNGEQRNINALNFSGIYAELVSGALDVDRLDFVPRDAYYTASKFGTIDIPRIISAISLTSIQGKYCICFKEKYRSYLEQFIFARREMYSNVYFHADKVKLEALVQAIIKRAVFIRNELSEDIEFLTIITNSKECTLVNVEDYLKLDDCVMFSKFQNWMNCKDPILRILCRDLIGGVGSVQDQYVYIGTLSCSIDKFFDGLKSLLPIDFEYAFLSEQRSRDVYPVKKDSGSQIRLLTDIGATKDFGFAAGYLNEDGTAKKGNSIHFEYLYWNESILREEIKQHFYNIEEDNKIDNMSIDERVSLVKKYIDTKKIRKNIEIEYKYNCGKINYEQIRKILDDSIDGFSSPDGFILHKQSDTYFDTPNRDLNVELKTLRIREVDGNRIMTIKNEALSENFGGNGSPLARQELEFLVKNNENENLFDIVSEDNYNRAIIRDVLCLTDEAISSLKPIVRIENDRKSAVITKKDAKMFSCELCFDSITFYNPNNNKKSDLYNQIEIELTSDDYLARVVLDDFNDHIKNSCGDIKPESKSKYELGVEWIINNP